MKYKILFPAFSIFLSISAFSQTTPPTDTSNIAHDLVWEKTEIEASFPGGEKAWTKYITKVMKKNIDDLVNDNKSGTCMVRFITDKQGNVSNVKPLTMKGSVLARIVVDAIADGPKWMPAQQNGQFVKAYKEQPVTFTIQENK